MAWNPSNQASFEARLFGLARALQDVRDEMARLADLYVQEGVAASPDFVGDKVTTTEMQDFITLGSHLTNFFENGTVPTQNRVSVITPFLGNTSV